MTKKNFALIIFQFVFLEKVDEAKRKLPLNLSLISATSHFKITSSTFQKRTVMKVFKERLGLGTSPCARQDGDGGVQPLVCKAPDRGSIPQVGAHGIAAGQAPSGRSAAAGRICADIGPGAVTLTAPPLPREGSGWSRDWDSGVTVSRRPGVGTARGRGQSAPPGPGRGSAARGSALSPALPVTRPQRIWGQARASGQPYLLGGRGTVGDEHERGDHVDGEPEQGDGVRGHPEWDPLQQPGPVELQRRLEQRDTRRAVAVLLQSPQLRRAQRLAQRPQPARRGPGPGACRHGRLRAPPPPPSAARAWYWGQGEAEGGAGGRALRRPGWTHRSGPHGGGRGQAGLPGSRGPSPEAVGPRVQLAGGAEPRGGVRPGTGRRGPARGGEAVAALAGHPRRPPTAACYWRSRSLTPQGPAALRLRSDFLTRGVGLRPEVVSSRAAPRPSRFLS